MKADKNFYEKYALSYREDLTMRLTLVSKVLEMVDFKGKEGLDVGCSTGFLPNALVVEGAKKMIGCDISSNAIKKAQVQAKKFGHDDKIDFVVCDAQKLPFKDKSFDFVICAEVLEHVEDATKTADELVRVLKPGGVLLATSPNILNPAEIAHTFKHILFYFLDKEPITHINHFTYFSFPRLFQKINVEKKGGWHMVTPFLPSLGKVVDGIDLKTGEMLFPFAFDLFVFGKKK